MLLGEMFQAGDVTEYDFLGDSADWKKQWTGDSRRHYWVFVFLARLALLHWVKATVVPLLKRNSLRPLRNLLMRPAGHLDRGKADVRFILAWADAPRVWPDTF